MPRLFVKSLSLTLGIALLKDLSFTLTAGDRIVLPGRNGAGKTQMINAVLLAIT